MKENVRVGLRVAFLSEKFPPDVGGLAVSAGRLAGMLASSGLDMNVFTLDTNLPPGQVASTKQQGLTIHRLGQHRRADDRLAAWFELITQRHQETPFDLIHAYFITEAGFVATYTGQYFNLPVIIGARGNDLERAAFDPGKFAHISFALSHMDIVTVNTADLARKARLIAPDCRVEVIPNGVDSKVFKPAAINEALLGSLGVGGIPVLGFVGEGRAKKGLATLLLAFKAISQKRKAALLLVGGVRPGDDEELVKVFQKQNPDLMLKVIPYMPQEELPSYYNLIDILLLPSLRDGLPNALLEGMACGRGVIASAVGGMADVISDGENGLLIPPGNVEALAERILELIDDGEKRQELGENARRTVLEQYTLENELEGNLRLYRQLAEGAEFF